MSRKGENKEVLKAWIYNDIRSYNNYIIVFAPAAKSTDSGASLPLKDRYQPRSTGSSGLFIDVFFVCVH